MYLFVDNITEERSHLSVIALNAANHDNDKMVRAHTHIDTMTNVPKSGKKISEMRIIRLRTML